MSVAITRRTLLGSSRTILAGAALGTLPRLSAAAEPAPPGPARLVANENPYGPGPAAREAIQAALTEGWKYPFGEEMPLKKMIAEREGLTPQNVVFGDGSSEILHIAGMIYGNATGELLTATPTFSMIAEHAKVMGCAIREVPLDARMRFDLKAIRNAVSDRTRLVYLCNPNNPTGTLVPGEEVTAFIASMPKDVPVFVDEAYLDLNEDFARDSAVSRVRAGDNVIVTRTFSKLHGMAGLRIGYGLARPDIVGRIEQLKNPTVGILALRAATASYQDLEFTSLSRKKIYEGLAITTAALEELKLPYAPTRANFVFFDTRQPNKEFLGAMRQKGFSLGRPFAPYDTWARVSMGMVEQMQGFAGALREHYRAS